MTDFTLRHSVRFSGLIALCAALIFPLTASHARADAPVALLTDVSGVAAAPAAFTEVQGGTGISLGRGSLRFVHYQSCKEIEVRGGTLTILADDYKLVGGKVLSEIEQPCPEKIKMLHSTAVAGGLVMRGPSRVPEIAIRPSLALVGPAAETATSIRLVDPDQKMVELPVRGHAALWDKRLSALADGVRYTISVMQGERVLMQFPVDASSERIGGPTLIEVR